MTDRFYPVGLKQEAELWKSTYEIQNEMRSYARSAFPPGTAVHQPGARDTFGFSCPGPNRARLAQGHLHPTEEVDVDGPRAHHAVPKTQAPDEVGTFYDYDVPEMQRSYRSPMVKAHFSPQATGMDGGAASRRGSGMNMGTGTDMGASGMRRSMYSSRSLPLLVKPTAPARVSTPPDHVHSHEDEHFDYFVPLGLQGRGKERLNPHTMSKLHKKDRISFPFSGEGTGFRSQSATGGLFPEGTYEGISTSTRTNFAKPSFHPHAPAARQLDAVA